MAKRIPTLRGDVLIFQTAKSFTVYAVGTVFEDGQREFHRQAENVKYVRDRGY